MCLKYYIIVSCIIIVYIVYIIGTFLTVNVIHPIFRKYMYLLIYVYYIWYVVWYLLLEIKNKEKYKLFCHIYFVKIATKSVLATCIYIKRQNITQQQSGCETYTSILLKGKWQFNVVCEHILRSQFYPSESLVQGYKWESEPWLFKAAWSVAYLSWNEF